MRASMANRGVRILLSNRKIGHLLASEIIFCLWYVIFSQFFTESVCIKQKLTIRLSMLPFLIYSPNEKLPPCSRSIPIPKLKVLVEFKIPSYPIFTNFLFIRCSYPILDLDMVKTHASAGAVHLHLVAANFWIVSTGSSNTGTVNNDFSTPL